jgi:carboxylesterase type B
MAGTSAELFIAIQSDRVFRMTAIRLAGACYRHKQPTLMYLFDWVSPLMNGILGSYHGLGWGLFLDFWMTNLPVTVRKLKLYLKEYKTLG